jgi:radical SAM protein with 4Fe4S-binding SPASM domain
MASIGTIIKRAFALTAKRPKGWKSLLYNTAMAKAGIAGPLMRPVHISIEPANVCNARCPVCETGNQSMPRVRGMLDKGKYERLIDEVAPYTSTLLFYFMGEPFLNKNAYEMIRYARENGIFVETCTNGDFVDAEGVIYSDINRISFQLGGLDNETHQIYRVRSDLDKATENIKALVKERKKNPDSNVVIEVGFIVMKHNEHQVNDFLSWANSLGVDLVNIIDPCVRNMEEGERFLTKDKKYWYYDEEAYEKGFLRPKIIPKNECTWIWNSMQLNWDGDAVPCCRDPNGLFVLGNVFEQGLDAVWNGEKARAFRKKISSAQDKVSICKLCSGYGVPDLLTTKPASFTIKRHTISEDQVKELEREEIEFSGKS